MILKATSLAFSLLLADAACAASQKVRSCARAADSLETAVQLNLRSETDSATYIRDLHVPCGAMRVFIAAASLPSKNTEASYGPRVVTLRPSTNGWAVTSLSRGLSDTHLPSLRLFASSDRVLVLAALGDEGGSWGIATYEVVDDTLVEHGLLDVGLPADENDQSALDRVAVSMAEGRWQASFAERIVLRPNQETREVIPVSHPDRITFRLNGDNWGRIP